MREINQWRRGIASRSGQLLRFGLLALLIGAAPAHAQRAERAATIQQRVLANGLEVIVVPGGGVPIATVELVV